MTPPGQDAHRQDGDDLIILWQSGLMLYDLAWKTYGAGCRN